MSCSTFFLLCNDDFKINFAPVFSRISDQTFAVILEILLKLLNEPNVKYLF